MLKKIIARVLIFVLFWSIAGCNQAEPLTSGESEPQSSELESAEEVFYGEIQTTIQNSNNSGNAQLQINYATDNITDLYESFHEFVHAEEGEWLIITTDINIKDFNYIKIGHRFTDDKAVFFVENIEYNLDELIPEKPFLVKTYSSYGTIPHFGISFLDNSNELRYFYISESGKDGSLSLVQFENEKIIKLFFPKITKSA
jgi:hypothetical protein